MVPELVSWEWHVRDRGGQARLDYTQNAINKTLVAPYSPRPAPGAPVSAPITWDELDDPTLRPDGFPARPWAGRVAGGRAFTPMTITTPWAKLERDREGTVLAALFTGTIAAAGWTPSQTVEFREAVRVSALVLTALAAALVASAFLRARRPQADAAA